MRTPHHLAPEGEAITQPELSEANWARDDRDLGEMEFISRHYADKLGLVSCLEMYMGLHEGQLVHASLLDAAAMVQLRIRWKGMRTREITTYIRQSAQGQCTPFSEELRECARTTEAMFFIHPTTMHFNGVIALRQRTNLTLIWCDSMQFDGSQAMMTYSQFYHCMEGGSCRQQFHPEQIYSSPLQIRTQTPTLPRQTNGTDCGIFTLMYQQTLSNWYGANAGQEFTEARVQNLIHELQEVTPVRVREHRTWLRHNMHKWWQGRWVAPTPVDPQGVAHQRTTSAAMLRTAEDSNQVLRQLEASHRTRAHDTQRIDLTTE